jgi:phenylacetate-CoA ligase
MAAGPHPSRAAIESGQLEQLRSLVAELFPGNSFYSQKYNAAGITFDVASLEDYSRRFPFTTKTELVEDQRAHPPFGSNLTFPLERYTRFNQTSGTAGTPLRWLDTPESWDWMLENWLEIYSAAGITHHDRIYFAFSFGPFLGFWTAFEAGTKLGALCLPGGSIPSMRARIEQLWPGARVFDHHGMTEVGPVTYECPQRPGVLHVMETAYYAELVEPASGKPIPAGQTGELVLTTLGRTGSPLLRYRTGDLVMATVEPCPCGRHTMTLPGGILGRTDDMIVVRGVNVFPSAVEEIIRAAGDVAEYQVRVSTNAALTELSLQIEAQPECGDVPALLQKIEKSFQTRFALRVAVTAVPFGTLPRPEMKSKRWVRG